MRLWLISPGSSFEGQRKLCPAAPRSPPGRRSETRNRGKKTRLKNSRHSAISHSINNFNFSLVPVGLAFDCSHYNPHPFIKKLCRKTSSLRANCSFILESETEKVISSLRRSFFRLPAKIKQHEENTLGADGMVCRCGWRCVPRTAGGGGRGRRTASFRRDVATCLYRSATKMLRARIHFFSLF